MKESKIRVCFIYVDTLNHDVDICMDLPFVPKIGEKIHIDTIDSHEYDVDLIVNSRTCILNKNYDDNEVTCRWEVYCVESKNTFL